MSDEALMMVICVVYGCGAYVILAIGWWRLRLRVGGASTMWGLLGTVGAIVTAGTFFACIDNFARNEGLMSALCVGWGAAMLTEAVAFVVAVGRIAKRHEREEAVTVYHGIPAWLILALFGIPTAAITTGILHIVGWFRVIRRVPRRVAKVGTAFAVAQLMLMIIPFLALLGIAEEIIGVSLVLCLVVLPGTGVCLCMVAGGIGREDLRPKGYRGRGSAGDDVAW